jgi:hypothetical protein
MAVGRVFTSSRVVLIALCNHTLASSTRFLIALARQSVMEDEGERVALL